MLYIITDLGIGEDPIIVPAPADDDSGEPLAIVRARLATRFDDWARHYQALAARTRTLTRADVEHNVEAYGLGAPEDDDQ